MASMIVLFHRLQFCAMAMAMAMVVAVVVVVVVVVASVLGISAGLAVGVQGIAHKVASEKVPVAK